MFRAEVNPAIAGFNGAVTFWLRKFGAINDRYNQMECFNGAVTFWLRKFVTGIEQAGTGVSFNGAVTFWLRKYEEFAFGIRLEFDRLQWGRNFLVTEIERDNKKMEF